MKKLIFLVIAVLFLVVFPAVMICSGISSPDDLSDIEKAIEEVKKNNTALEKRLAQKTSSVEIYIQASAAGYEEILAEKPATGKVALIR